MAILSLSLLLQVGFVIGSNYRHGEWNADQERENRARQTIYSTHINNQRTHLRKAHPFKAVTGRSVIDHKADEPLQRVVNEFLHTGDSSALKLANCSHRYELGAHSSRTPHESMHTVLDTVMHAANFLNMVLQTNRSQEQSLVQDVEWYYALVRSILEGDSKIHRAVVTFNTDSMASGPAVFLRATREGSEIVLQDLSGSAKHLLRNKTSETEWFHGVKSKKKSQFHKRVLTQDIESLDASVRRGESFVSDRSHIKWSAPYLECQNGHFIPRWLLTLSAGLYGLKEHSALDFRGAVRVDVDLQAVDINQCSSEGWFAGTHRCNQTSMECLPIPGHGFVLDKYMCHCKRGFYHPNRVSVNGYERNGHMGTGLVEGPYDTDITEDSAHCMPCQEGCAYCKDDTPCIARGDSYLRLAVLSFQGLCMLGDFISMILVYHFRRNKSIRASGLVLLEAILIGALFLYFPVMILYFQPGVFRCILLRWVRLLGFAIVYGTVTLKLYRVLKVFLSRTAQRIPYMTSWRVLRLLGIILLVVCWFLVAWTSAICQNLDRKLSLIAVGFTPEGLQFSMCLLDRWDYMMAVAEFLFLLWGVYLCYAVRTVPSAFHEPRYMAIAVHNELILSAVFHVIRFSLAHELHPDWMLMLFFMHTHLTVTVTLGLLLIPKFLFGGTHLTDDIATEAYEDELDMGRSGSYLNSSITSAWSEHSLDPEDIREELKKLYSQLEVYKRKKMLANNPHLQKKRSSKKGLGRSLMRRITEIPETVRQCSREDKDTGDHGSSNRNSICALRKNPFDPSHSTKPAKEESLRSKVFSLKKSHSSYDHVRDQSEDSSSSTTDKMEASTTESSLLDTLMGKKLVKKKSSEKLDSTSESTESMPLVCKSASAHNLTADKKPLHPRTSMLQKSLSVIASAKEKTLGLTAKAQSMEEATKKAHQKPKEAQTPGESEEKLENSSKMIISQSVEYKQPATKTGIMKQPTSGSQLSISTDPAKIKELLDLSEVCPWEVEDLPTPSENKVQKHVSIAPDETTTIHGKGTPGTKAQQQQKRKASEPSPSSSHRLNQKSGDRADICPWEEASESQSQMEGSRPSPSSQPSGSVGSAESTKAQRADVCPWDCEEAPAESTKAQRAEVCPWDCEEALAKSADAALSADKGRDRSIASPTDGRRKGTTPTDVKGKGNTLVGVKGMGTNPPDSKGKSATNPPDSKGKSATNPPDSKGKSAALVQPTAFKTDVCPWDYESLPAKSPSSEKTPSLTQVSKTRESSSKTKEAASTRTLETEAEKERKKAKEADDDKSKMKAKDKLPSGKPTQKQARQTKVAEVCPWDVDGPEEVLTVEKRRSANAESAKGKQVDVCPWDFQEPSDSKGTNKSPGPSVAKQKSPSPKGGPSGDVKKADVCPWDFEEPTSGKKA
ncbi:probable G-protein coupled receptor 158 isoform X2 [Clupea harengus]|uniref:Probable G-protein coupled receptor 158 isoform X2 n=1 Tax=Clupea harengus TaxID=7950 RepID=A0A6P3VFX2_CLUHA|nr:probable G-protein coupled receptor 158 isoform X2 [Clupea harengus]